MTFISVLMCTIVLCSATTTWEPIGPGGGLVSRLAVAPSNDNIICGTWQSSPLSFYKSTNGAASWQAMNNIGPSIAGFAIAIDPTNPNIIYTGGASPVYETSTYLDTVYKTTDGGSTWVGHSVINTTQSFAILRDIAVHPTIPSIIFAVGTLDWYMACFKSTDGGETWDTTYIFNGEAYAIALDASNPDNVYVGGYRYSDTINAYVPLLFKSTDGGVSFDDITSGLPLSTGEVGCIVVCPTNSNYVYLGTGCYPYAGSPYGGPGDIFRSTDGGTSWSLVLTSDSSVIYGLGTTLADPNIIYASTDLIVYKSTDAGVTWYGTAQTPTGGGYGLAVSSSNADMVYIANYSAVSKTTDGGATWVYSSAGINNRTITGLGIAPSSPGIIYTGDLHAYKTTNSGGDWDVPSQSWLSTGDFAVHNTNAEIVFCLSGGCTGG